MLGLNRSFIFAKPFVRRMAHHPAFRPFRKSNFTDQFRLDPMSRSPFQIHFLPKRILLRPEFSDFFKKLPLLRLRKSGSAVSSIPEFSIFDFSKNQRTK